MAEMGLGYGSEFQLMRFLGHHKDSLNAMVQKATNLTGEIHWLDFPQNGRRVSGDGEFVGIDCFKELDHFDSIKKAWMRFWPQRGSSMNWDAVLTIGDTWCFVEAKAHEEESFQPCTATSEVSKEKIREAFSLTANWLDATPDGNWIDSNCYQLANRLAFMYFCKKIGIKAKLIYIGFVNGYKGIPDEVQSSEDWYAIWDNELKTLGLEHAMVDDYIAFVHPDCKNPNNE